MNSTFRIANRFSVGYPFPFRRRAFVTDYAEGVRRFKQWIELVESLEIPEFEDCTKAYRRWFWGITESFMVPYSNGFTEGKNKRY